MRMRFRVAERPKVQLHLSTCVVLMMVFGAMIGMNILPEEVFLYEYNSELYAPRITPEQARPSETYIRGYQYGCPMPVYMQKEEVRAENGDWQAHAMKGEFMMPFLSIPLNIMVWLGIMVAGAFAMEEYNHNRKRTYKKRPREVPALTPGPGGVECHP
ncbi:MAG: hypothetical protein L6R28_12060 [Planctomycetes bacterium]|nr:hypothetical protein [Planctomycetota bacterium]